jgi:hypothetical protein
MSGTRTTNSIRALLAVGFVIQALVLSQVAIKQLWPRLLSVRSESTISRSATIAFGDEFDSFIDFLLQHIPEDGLVVLPPKGSDIRFSDEFLMQFYLMPRVLTNCPEPEQFLTCLRDRSGPRTFMISVGANPDPRITEIFGTYLPHSGEFGLYAPQ